MTAFLVSTRCSSLRLLREFDIIANAPLTIASSTVAQAPTSEIVTESVIDRHAPHTALRTAFPIRLVRSYPRLVSPIRDRTAYPPIATMTHSGAPHVVKSIPESNSPSPVMPQLPSHPHPPAHP